MKTARSITEIGKLIKFYRQQSGLTQGQLAELCGLSQVAISNLENGAGVSLVTMVKAMRALNLELSFNAVKGIDTDELLGLLD